jgi:uncharacterized membrane protein YeaQ/YmgE (transglycosylase-associated protein family)
MLDKLVNKYGDKTLHVWAGMLISALSGLLLYWLYQTNIFYYPLIGVIAGNIVGFSKEFIYDKLMKKGTFSLEDILATFYGSLVGAILILMIIGSIEGLGK